MSNHVFLQPPEEPHVKGGNATLKLYGVSHYQMMGKLSAAKRKQVLAEIETVLQRLVGKRLMDIVEENEAQRVKCKEVNAND